MGEVRVPAEARWGAQTQRAVENFPISGRPIDRALIGALASIKGAAATVNARLKVIAEGHRRRDPRRRRRGGRGRLGRPVPDRRVPDRLGHVVEHERERGASPSLASRAARRAGPPQRPRQRVAVVERRVPVGHPPRGRPRRSTRRPDARRSSTSRRRCGRRQREFAHGREVGPHPPHGRHAGHARPGVRRLRRAGRATASSGSRDALPRVGELPLGGTAVGTGINAPKTLRPQASSRGWPTTLDLPLTEAPRPLRRAGRPRRARRDCRGQLRDARRVARSRSPTTSAGWAAGPRTGLAEIRLPDLQPGSSIMPGKVNPVHRRGGHPGRRRR